MSKNYWIHDENDKIVYSISREDVWITIDFDLYDSNNIVAGNITNGFYFFRPSYQISIKGKESFDLLQKFPYTGIRYYFDNRNWKIIRHDIYNYTISDNGITLFTINYIKAQFERFIECDIKDETLCREAICVSIAISLFNK